VAVTDDRVILAVGSGKICLLCRERRADIKRYPANRILNNRWLEISRQIPICRFESSGDDLSNLSADSSSAGFRIFQLILISIFIKLTQQRETYRLILK